MHISTLHHEITSFTGRVVGLAMLATSRHRAFEMRVSHRALPAEWRDQPGIYAFHTDRKGVYVGRAARDSLGMRIRDQVRDRGDIGWNKVIDSGFVDVFAFSESDWIWVPSLEVALIEAGTPSRNKRRC